jgi:pteridine reductase
MTEASNLSGKVALITGAARRVGAAIARVLHGAGMNIIIHYRRSSDDALRLHRDLNTIRSGSASLLQWDLRDAGQFDVTIERALKAWGRLDALINNASTFYRTPVGTVTTGQWDELMQSNLKAPYFLAQAAAPALRARGGCIVNITDVHAERPLRDFSVYSISKAGLTMMTKALARELGPEIRVNAVAPGAVLWPEDGMAAAMKQRILDRTALKRQGEPGEVALAVLFLVREATYTTGQTIVVDGGRSLYT